MDSIDLENDYIDFIISPETLEHTPQPENLIKEFNLEYRISKNVSFDAAKLLSKGRIIGWFQGRSELGPRSLGARSVLADPRKIENKAKVNQFLKKLKTSKKVQLLRINAHFSAFFAFRQRLIVVQEVAGSSRSSTHFSYNACTLLTYKDIKS